MVVRRIAVVLIIPPLGDVTKYYFAILYYKARLDATARIALQHIYLSQQPRPKGPGLNNHRLKPVGLNCGLKVRIRVA